MTTTLLPLLFALLAPQDPPPTATELVPLQALCGREMQIVPPPWTTLLRHVSAGDRTIDLVANADDPHVLDPDQIVELMYRIEGEAIDSGMLFLRPIGQNLMVFGERDAVRRTRGLLEAATQVVARPIEIEFSVWDASDRETPPPVVDAAGYARFTKNGKALWRTLATGRSGDAMSLDHTTWKRYVRTLEVEVAQKQDLSRPATDLYATGGHAVVRPFALIAGDEFALHVQFAAAEERELRRTLQTGIPGASELELPRLESCFGTCSGRVENGGALCVTMRGSGGGGGQLLLMIRARSATPPAAMGRGDLAVVPCGALTTNALDETIALPRPLDREGETVTSESGAYGLVPAEELVEMAMSLLASHESAEETEVRCDGVHLFVHGPANAVAAVTALLQNLQDQVVQNVSLHHVASLENITPGADGANPSPRTGSKLHEISLPSLLGREACAIRMLETNVVNNVQIEIAQEASTLVPEVGSLQIGTWLRARCTPLPTGTQVDMEVLSCDAAIPIARSVQQGGGVLMQTDLATTRLRHSGAVADGHAVEHGNGPRVTVDGRAFDSTMRTTIRR